ncbi:hypothetical protein cypCar_00047515 [Cyprinus carpio]|nr:hypothetical protein cypCar_00047515 [Cyprinus carpio]
MKQEHIPCLEEAKAVKDLGKEALSAIEVLRDNIQGITNRHSSSRSPRRSQAHLRSDLLGDPRGAEGVPGNVIRDAVTYTEHAKKKDRHRQDVVYGFKRQGRTLYGSEFKTVNKNKTALLRAPTLSHKD